VPWLVIFGVLTLVPQTAVCYYLMLAAWVSQHPDCKRTIDVCLDLPKISLEWELTVNAVQAQHSAAEQQSKAAACRLTSDMI
jgi:hypothetical protein